MNHSPQKHNNNTFYGSSLIIASSLFYGGYGIWIRLMGNSFGPYMQAWIRAAIVLLVMLPIALYGRQKWQPIRWRQDKWWLIVWCFANWMIGAPLYYAINRIGIGLATLVYYTGYLVAMLVLGWLLSGEKYGPQKLLATVLAVAGLCLTYAPSFHGASLLPFGAALIAGICTGLDLVVSQKITYNSSQTTVLAWATGIVGSLPTAFILREHVPSLLNIHWVYLLLFVVVCIASSWLSIHGIKMIEAGAAGILGLLEIVWALIFGIVFFDERPHALVYLGAVCIMAAATIPYLKTVKKGSKEVIEEIPV
jgi:drug/metabolite transporter (DMT)-like permease